MCTRVRDINSMKIEGTSTSVRDPGRHREVQFSGAFWDSPLKMKGMLLDLGPLPPRKMHNVEWASGFLKQCVSPLVVLLQLIFWVIQRPWDPCKCKFSDPPALRGALSHSHHTPWTPQCPECHSSAGSCVKSTVNPNRSLAWSLGFELLLLGLGGDCISATRV